LSSSLDRSVLTRPPAVGALALAAVGYLAVVDPNQPGHYPSCPFLFVTGRYCPGCGGLRAIHDLFHGELTAALSSNVLVVLMVPLGLLLWLCWTGNLLSDKDIGIRFRAWWGWAGVAVMLVFWVLRNLPATGWLAP
jgi:hypothetical protein